jgi:hypothetical protein
MMTVSLPAPQPVPSAGPSLVQILVFTAVMRALGCDPATALSVAASAWAMAYAHRGGPQ